MDPITAGFNALSEFFKWATEVEKNLTPEQREKNWALGNKLCDAVSSAIDKLRPKEK